MEYLFFGIYIFIGILITIWLRFFNWTKGPMNLGAWISLTIAWPLVLLFIIEL